MMMSTGSYSRIKLPCGKSNNYEDRRPSYYPYIDETIIYGKKNDYINNKDYEKRQYDILRKNLYN